MQVSHCLLEGTTIKKFFHCKLKSFLKWWNKIHERRVVMTFVRCSCCSWKLTMAKYLNPLKLKALSARIIYIYIIFIYMYVGVCMCVCVKEEKYDKHVITVISKQWQWFQTLVLIYKGGKLQHWYQKLFQIDF